MRLLRLPRSLRSLAMTRKKRLAMTEKRGSGCGLELIADTGHGGNITGVSGVSLELGSQTTDEDMQILSFLSVFKTPDLVQEVGMGKNLSRIQYEFLQESVFGWGQFDFFAGNSYLSLGEVNMNVTGGKGGLGRCGGSRLGAPKHCPDPSYQFSHPERFSEVIIGAKFKAFYLVLFITPGAEHDNRDL